MEDEQTLGNSSFCFISLIVFVQKQPRSDAAGVALRGKIYVVGGFDGANQLRSVERFNPRTGRWKKVALATLATKRREEPLQVRSMGTARSGVAAAALDGDLFVVGGWDGTRRLRTGEVINNTHLLIANKHIEQVYDPATNRWRSLPKMNTPR